MHLDVTSYSISDPSGQAIYSFILACEGGTTIPFPGSRSNTPYIHIPADSSVVIPGWPEDELTVCCATWISAGLQMGLG